MIIDVLSELSDNQDASSFTAAGPNASTNVIDTQKADRNLGEGTQLILYASVGDTAIAGTSSTLAVILEDSPDNSTWTTRLQSEPIAEASLVAGAEIFRGAIPEKTQRYLRINWDVGAADLTAGKVNAHIGIG